VAVGDNSYGQCNVGSWTNIQQVAAGFYHTVGLKTDGTVVAVGYNSYGQCDVGSWTNIQQVAAGEWNTVGLKRDGTVVVVGYNPYGQLDDVYGWSLGIFPTLPDIKVNGSGGPVSVSPGDNIVVTLSLDAGSQGGKNADWWIAADTPFGWYYYSAYSLQWSKGLSFSYLGPLGDVVYVELLRTSGLPAGNYVFYFGVDMTMNGAIDAPLYYDSVALTLGP